mgnify:CR=1 FL=1
MLARGHRLRVGQQGTVGYVTSRGEPRIALDVGEDAVFFNNPDLPETRSAVTLPLRVHGDIIGALDVQSKEPAAFSNESAEVLQSLADQIALAINNANLFLRAQESAEAERRARGEITREMWARLLRQESDLGYLSNAQGVFPAEDTWRPEMASAIRTAKIVMDEQDNTRLAVPLEVAGQVIGVLDGYKAQGWAADEITIVQALVEQLNAAVERARLYRETQRRVAREGAIREISDEMQRATDMDSLLRITAEALNRTLHGSRVYVSMADPDQPEAGDLRIGEGES